MMFVAVVLGVLLSTAAALTVTRMVIGPSTLDRVVALDMLTAVIVCGLAGFAAVTLDTTMAPVLVVVSLLGFVGSVSIARFLGKEEEHQ